MSNCGTLPISVLYLWSDAGRRKVIGIIAGRMLWPDDPEKAAIWAEAVSALTYLPPATVEEHERQQKSLFLAGSLWKEAHVRYYRSHGVGRAFADFLDSHIEAGYGFRVAPHGVRGNLPFKNVHAARKAVDRKEEEETFVWNWKVYGGTAPFSAARITLGCFKENQDPISFASYPCSPAELPTFLRVAQMSLRGAERKNLKKGLWGIPHDVLDLLKRGPDDDFVPAVIEQ